MDQLKRKSKELLKVKAVWILLVVANVPTLLKNLLKRKMTHFFSFVFVFKATSKNAIA